MFNDNIVLIQMYQNVYNMYLYHNLRITNPLFQLVNKQMTHTYCRVTMKHIAHVHGAGSELYSPLTWSWTQMGT